MRHRGWRGAGLALAMLAAAGVLRAQDATLFYKDRAAKKTVESAGTIVSEDFLGIKFKPKSEKDVKTIPAADIEKVYYLTKDVTALDYRDPFNKQERATDLKGDDKATLKRRDDLLSEAAEKYAAVEKDLKLPAAKRYVGFRRAELAVLQAKLYPEKTEAAIKALTEFKAAHREGWELLLALDTLAKMHEAAGRADDARKAYEELAELPGAPAEVKEQSAVLVGKLHLRGRQYKEAEAGLSKLVAGMSGANPQKPLAQAYLIESQVGQDKAANAEKELNDLIRGNADPRLRSVAYSLLGDYYAKKGQPNEAFWAYLRVDAQYNEDADAQARALYALAGLFDKVKKDPLRGRECMGRLLDKRFEGTPQQKLAQAAAEKKTEE